MQKPQPSTQRKALPAKLTITVLVIAAVVVTIMYLTRQEPVKVVIQEIGQGLVQSSVSNTRAGTINACRRARIAPATGGQVSVVNVKEGERVKQGQLLLELWNDDVTAQLELARQESIAAQAKAEDACIRADDAAREAKRLTQLHARGLASDERRDQAVSEAKARNATCRAAQATLLVSEAQIAVRQAALSKTVLKAPFAGIVADVFPEVGEYVTPSPFGIATPPAVDLIDDVCVYVTAPIDEVDAASIRTGMPATITLDALRDRRFEGTVRRIAPYVEDLQKQARTVDVEVEFDDPQDANNLLTGYSADVEIILQQIDNVLRIPTQAVLEGNRVLLLDAASGELVERTFSPGLSNWRYTQVRDGLKQSDLLVTSLDREGVRAGVNAVRETTTE